jgi:DNA gyrase subunit A
VRTSADGVSVLGRNTQGVRLISLRDGERLVNIARIVESEEGDENGANDAAAPA